MELSHISCASNFYHGLNTSLYKTLSKEAIHHVEHSIWLRKTGFTDAARLVFDTELHTIITTPIIVIERANLELEAGRWGQAWRILDVALKDLMNAKASLDLPEHRLITLMWVMFGIRHRGDLTSAVQELERTRQWLCNVRVAEYTDIQTSCVRFYVLAYVLITLSSDFHDPAMENVPMSDSGTSADQKEPWGGLHDLRRSLVKRQMFNEANALFRVELNRTSLTDREPVVEEFLAEIATLPSSIEKDLIESFVRLQWSATYVQVQNEARAIEELAGSEAAFSRWCHQFNITDTRAIPQFHALKCAKLDTIHDEFVKLQEAEQFMDTLANTDSSKTGMIISTATESAFALFQEKREIQYLEKYFSFHKRLEQYDEEVSEDLCDLVVHRNSLISFTSTNLVDRQKSLEWIAGFFKRYPDFKPPREMESLHRQKSILLRGLRRLDESKEAEEEANRWKDQGPSLGKCTHLIFGTTINSEHYSPYSKYHDEIEDRDLFFRPWIIVVGDHEKMVNTACDLLYRWAIEDVRNGRLTIHKYQEMINGTYQDAEDSNESNGPQRDDEIDKDERKTLITALIPPDSASAEIYRERWHLIMDWLSNPPKDQRMRRLFCLLMLREARQDHFYRKQLWDLRIHELKQIIEFHSKLPPGIHEINRFQPSAWHAGLAFTYMVQLGNAPDLSKPSVYEIVLQAEKYCNRAIKQLCEKYQPSQFLLQQRLGAQICLLKITRLEQRLASISNDTNLSHQHEQPNVDSRYDASSSRESIEKEITALCDTGLKKIRESEQISTASELGASLLDGLDGLNERQCLLEFQASFWTVHNAIHLLLKERKPKEETTITIWNWVQKYKARSLARTMGRRSGVPPGLLSQILSSAEARPIYEEMLSLEKRIENATLNARFDLQLQLDATYRRMRLDPILRRLVDLREGSPLDLTDIRAIEEQAGRPVVLVDWFYLPPYPNNGIGRLLLLTARAGRTPTINVLDTRVEDVYAWQSEFLDPEKLCFLETRHEFNKRLGGLVAPLLQYSEENEVLVFCPSAILHRIPLHALHVTIPIPKSDNKCIQPLICRNPVVYIQSLSLLRSSFSAAEHARCSPQAVNPQFMAGISKADATAVVNGRQMDYTAGRASIYELAKLFEARPMIDKSASKQDFMKEVTQSRLLHLHTHCNWKFADPLDHHIEFPNLGVAETMETSQNLKLTAKEIFEIRLRPGTHVNMIACQGGLMDVKLGDEVMGLVPALLYSGATSTISTLWSIADGAGAEFSKLFFDKCKVQSEDTLARFEDMGNALSDIPLTSRTCFVDIATAVQGAVKDMSSSGNEPLYSWAGFVLHGYWMFSVPWKDTYRFGQDDYED